MILWLLRILSLLLSHPPNSIPKWRPPETEHEEGEITKKRE
jgi:hypothetical protein